MPKFAASFAVVMIMAITAWIAPLPAIGQSAPWATGLERPLESRMSPQEFETLVEHFEPNAELASQLETAFAAHQERFQRFVERATPIVDEANDRRDAAERGWARWVADVEREKTLRPVATEQAELDRLALHAFESILRPDDESRWNAYLYSLLRRTTAFSKSLFPENRVDPALGLREILSDERLSDERRAVLDAALAEYTASWNQLASRAIAMIIDDRRHNLQRMHRYAREHDDGRVAFFTPSTESWPEQQRLLESQIAVDKALSRAGRNLLAAVRSLLPHDQSLDLEENYFAAAINWSNDPAGRWELDERRQVLASIFELENLSDDQRESIGLVTVQARALVLAVARDLVDRRNDLAAAANSGRPVPVDSVPRLELEVEDLEQRLHRAEARLIESVAALLTPAQQAAVGLDARPDGEDGNGEKGAGVDRLGEGEHEPR